MILYQVLFIYLLFIKQPFLELNHFLQALTKWSVAGSQLLCTVFCRLKQDWENLHYSCILGINSRNLVEEDCRGALRWPQLVPGASETSINSPLPPKTLGRFKRGLRVPMPATRGGTHSIGNAAGNMLWAGGTAAMGDPCWGSNTPKGLQLWGTHARAAAPPKALRPVGASLEQDMKKENSGKNSKMKRSKHIYIYLWDMSSPPALLFISAKAVGNTGPNLKRK